MSDRSLFTLDRGWFTHPAFAKEPFTEREAFAWLMAEAAWVPRRKRIGNTVFDLERGQLAASIRFMAKAWRWTPAKVQRFLNRRKIDTMIDTRADHDATVITVCNYNKWQFSPALADTPSDTHVDTSPIHQRYKLEEINNLNNNIEREIDSETASNPFPRKRASKTSLTLENPDFERFWGQYPKKTDIGNARRLYDRIVVERTATPAELLAGAMRYSAERSGEDDKYTKSPVNWLTGECWRNPPRQTKSPPRAGSQASKTKADSAIEGVMSYFRERNEQ